MSVLIPIPRKSAYQTFFFFFFDEHIQGAYQWHQDLAAEAFLILCDFEVLFRSKFHHVMASLNCRSGRDDWIISSTVRISLIETLKREIQEAKDRNEDFYPDPKNYNLHSAFNLTKKDKKNFINIIVDFLKKGKDDFNHDDLISSVSFGFWGSILKRLKTKDEGRLIESYLKNIFPFSSKEFDEEHLDNILDTLNRIKDLRNRIGHHDSIMRIPEPVEDSYDFYPKNLKNMIKSLTILLLSLLELVRDIDPLCAEALQNSKNWKSFFLLLKPESFHVYKANSGKLESYIICYLNECYMK